eukprot:TRINITY_DN3522_c1_g1_i1.p1 TRINITY_DN3522_c1_g1~~TRINITY_DN3522_c1_g1_i1.p1  ORF type:complete len:377 (-),score=53.28 TRINITY_DN3522_c1_g1_i1:17-1072(-)
MGLLAFCVGGVGFVLIGVWEVIISTYAHLNNNNNSPPSSLSTTQTNTTNNNKRAAAAPTKLSSSSSSSSITFVAIAFLSSLHIVNSVFSTVDAFRSNDRVGLVLQLDVIAVASLFLLYSALALFVHFFTHRLPLPSSILNLIALFAFAQQFFLFYLQRKDPFGLENRYYDLLLLPILVCTLSSILGLVGFTESPFPRLACGVGLILQGTWFFQMGFSFYTNLMMPHGCALHQKSRGNFTVTCKGHPDYHRSKAIATLQFNCHLAFLVALLVAFNSIMSANYQGSRVDYLKYKPLQRLHHFGGNHTAQFTLNSVDDDDDDDDDDDEEMITEGNASKQMAVSPESGINGFGDH